jgi:DNA topoisomerase I
MKTVVATSEMPRKEDSLRPAHLSEPTESAKAARLRYVTDQAPGIRRRRSGKGFVYIGLDGKSISDPGELRRFRSLAIPPAWCDVWICPSANGHLQATGRDSKGRKQHRYHARWREVRDATKYHRMLEFARILPAIRRKVEQDLALPGLPRDKILGTVIRLLETSLIRVGNEEYMRQNNSFGLATLRSRHVNVSGSNICFDFRGKSGVQHAVDLTDRRLARIIKQCQELPGHELFQYIGEDGERYTIDSADVNEYLRRIAGDGFSSKDFRTWAGTVLAARELGKFESARTQAVCKKNVQRVVESVAEELGNTKAVCRKCYIHPGLIEAYSDGSLAQLLRRDGKKATRTKRLSHGLKPEEAAVLALLKRQPKPSTSLRSDVNLRQRLKASLRGTKTA